MALEHELAAVAPLVPERAVPMSGGEHGLPRGVVIASSPFGDAGRRRAARRLLPGPAVEALGPAAPVRDVVRQVLDDDRLACLVEQCRLLADPLLRGAQRALPLLVFEGPAHRGREAR